MFTTLLFFFFSSYFSLLEREPGNESPIDLALENPPPRLRVLARERKGERYARGG